jgi:copper chaperone CopZ
MFKIFNHKKSNPNTRKIELTISGMHCVSCSMNIDGELEDLSGIEQAKTSYASGKTIVAFDPQKVQVSDIIQVITKLGYKVTAQNLTL